MAEMLHPRPSRAVTGGGIKFESNGWEAALIRLNVDNVRRAQSSCLKVQPHFK